MEEASKAEEKWKDKCDHYRERAAALQDTVEKLTVSTELPQTHTPHTDRAAGTLHCRTLWRNSL